MKTEQDIINPHPDELRLLAYLDAPKSTEFQTLRQHLATCAPCRKEVDTLQSMLQNLQNTPVMPTETLREDHPDEFVLADYVEKRLSPDRHSQIKRHISECENCTRMVLHYAVSISEMETDTPVSEEVISPKKSPLESEVQENIFSKLRQVFSWRMPVWIGVPATALAAVALLFMIYTGEKKVPNILVYQDRPEVIFSSPKGRLPGIGFLGNSRERSEPFGGIKIESQDENRLHLSWSKIETAILYEVKLYSSNDSDHTVIGKAETTGETEVFLQVAALLPDQHYQWELSGQTKDGLSFLARGGFVVGLQVKF